MLLVPAFVTRCRWSSCFSALLLLGVVTEPLKAIAGSFPDQVVSFTPGSGAGFGASFYPGNVLGPPNGSSDPTTPTFTEQDLLSLGDGGTIVLKFTNSEIYDAPGIDFTIFENPVQPLGIPTQSFADTAIVSVSVDGVTWSTFPFNYIPPGPGGSLLNKSNYVGFAGVNASLSSPSNGISPFDPAVSGGDSFDLAQVGLSHVRYVKIHDTGSTGTTQTVDPQGDIVDDPGNHLAFSPSVGFDLDAVAAIHTTPPVAAVREDEWTLYQ